MNYVLTRVMAELDPTPAIKEVFPHDFNLTYVVTLAAHELSTDIHVENPSSDSTLSFQTLLHTYYAADASAVKVEPLKGLTYINKVKGGIDETENRDVVDVQNFTDFVYRDAPKKYTIHTGDATIQLKAIHLNDVVVWNPGQEAGSKIGDMEDKGWYVPLRDDTGTIPNVKTLGNAMCALSQEVHLTLSISLPRSVGSAVRRLPLCNIHSMCYDSKSIQDKICTLNSIFARDKARKCSKSVLSQTFFIGCSWKTDLSYMGAKPQGWFLDQ
jgi:hypothetical protein